MNKIVVITPITETEAFRLAGVTQISCRKEEMLSALQSALELEDLALVIVDERLTSDEFDEQLHYLDSHWAGIITVLPAPTGETAAGDLVARLIQRAVGYHVRLTA